MSAGNCNNILINVTSPLIQDLTDIRNPVLVDGRHLLETMQKLHDNGDLEYIQKYILACFTVSERNR